MDLEAIKRYVSIISDPESVYDFQVMKQHCLDLIEEVERLRKVLDQRNQKIIQMKNDYTFLQGDN